MNRRLASVLLHAVLIAGAIVTVAPLAWMVSASLMPSGEATSLPPRLLPTAPTLAHYITLFTRLDLSRYFANSLLIAGSSTAMSLVINSMAGYAFAKLRFRGRDRLFQGLITGMVVPVQVAMLPMFLLMKSMGLINTYWGVIIPGMSSIFGIFMVRQYALSIPDDLLDAARVDGASEQRIFWTLVMPALRPILATLAVFMFMSSWNDFMWPLIALSDDRLYTLPVALANLVGEHVQDTELMMAGSVITVLPVLGLFLLLQREYMRGVFVGSLKD